MQKSELNSLTEADKIAEIEKIYNEKPDVPIMGPNKTGMANKIFKILALLLLVASLVTWLVYFIISNIEAKPAGSLDFSIEAPAKAIPGGSVKYIVRLSNEDNVDVMNASVRLNYPDGFVFRNSSIEPEQGPNNTWLIDKLPAQQDLQIEINGALLGDSDAPRVIFGVINYELEGFRSRLELSDSQTTFLGDEIVSVDLTGDRLIKINEEGEFTVLVENIGDETLYDLTLSVQLLGEANISDSENSFESTDTETRWMVKELQAGETKTYNLTGIWTSSEQDNLAVLAKLEATALSGIKYIMATDVLDITIEQAELSTSIIINDIERNSVVPNGENIVLTLQINNNSNEDATVDGLKLIAPTDVIAWENVDLKGGVRTVNEVVWTSEALGALAEIPAEDTKALVLVLPVLPGTETEEPVTFSLELI